jgi:Trypsin-co-occurring domain 1
MDVALISDVTDLADMGTASVDTDRLRDNLQKIRDALAPVVQQQPGGMSLESLEVALGLTVGGEIGFIAKGSVEASASITLTFKREP